jgi:IS5 family transposase
MAPVFMFKALLRQSWYSLSDPKLESLLVRALLCRHFVSLSLADSVPDHSSNWRFRQVLEKQGLMDSLLAEINRQQSIQARRNRPKKTKTVITLKTPQRTGM